MKYMGSKSRIVDNILPIIQERLRDYNIKTYIEPFCGGCNVIDKVQCDTKIASDNQKYLIALLKNVQEITEFPDELTREHYSEVRECFNKGLNTYPDWYIGAIGFLGSYNGRFYDGGFAKTNYSKSKTTDHIIIRNYYKEAKENLIEQIPRLEDIQFQCGDYKELYSDKVDCLFYCDIPYKGTKQYGSSKNFDYDRFWNWAEKMSERNIVLVSEHEAPLEWKCIWQQEVKRTIDNTKRVKAVEKLFEIRE